MGGWHLERLDDEDDLPTECRAACRLVCDALMLTLALLSACGEGTGQAPLEGDVYKLQRKRLTGSLHIATSETLIYLIRHCLADFQRIIPPWLSR